MVKFGCRPFLDGVYVAKIHRNSLNINYITQKISFLHIKVTFGQFGVKTSFFQPIQNLFNVLFVDFFVRKIN